MADMVFFGILLTVYLLIGLIIVPIMFSDSIQDAEKKDSDSANICAGLFVLVILWPLAHFIKKHNFRQ